MPVCITFKQVALFSKKYMCSTLKVSSPSILHVISSSFLLYHHNSINMKAICYIKFLIFNAYA